MDYLPLCSIPCHDTHAQCHQKVIASMRPSRQELTRPCSVGPFAPVPDYLAIVPGVGFEGVWIPPAPDRLFIGDVKTFAEQNKVDRVKIPGYWMHKKDSTTAFGAPPAPGEKILLAFHGGAYVRLSGHPKGLTAKILHGFLQEVPCVQRVFSVEYRLSKVDANAFPAALLDAIASYDYLVNTLGFSPLDIIVVGDSAGGNLALALTRFLVEYRGQDGVPAIPSAVLLLSPWADMGISQASSGSAVDNTVSDYIAEGKYFVLARKAFCGSLGPEICETSKWVSPASVDPRVVVDFKGFPRTYIVCGGAEVLADTIRTLRDRMVADLGDKVGYYEAPDAFHDYMAFSSVQPERSETYAAISRWLEAEWVP